MCKYCDDFPKAIFDGDGVNEPKVYIEDGCLCLEFEQAIEEADIVCCPMCGGDVA